MLILPLLQEIEMGQIVEGMSFSNLLKHLLETERFTSEQIICYHRLMVKLHAQNMYSIYIILSHILLTFFSSDSENAINSSFAMLKSMGFKFPRNVASVIYRVWKLTKFRSQIHALNPEEQIQACWNLAATIMPVSFKHRSNKITSISLTTDQL